METLTAIRQYADQLDGTLTLILEESPELSSGARSALAQCIDTVRNILEEINNAPKQKGPSTVVQSRTKNKNLMGEPRVSHQHAHRGNPVGGQLDTGADADDTRWGGTGNNQEADSQF